MKVKEREMQKVIQVMTTKRARKSARASSRVAGGVAGVVIPAARKDQRVLSNGSSSGINS